MAGMCTLPTSDTLEKCPVVQLDAGEHRTQSPPHYLGLCEDTQGQLNLGNLSAAPGLSLLNE